MISFALRTSHSVYLENFKGSEKLCYSFPQIKECIEKPQQKWLVPFYILPYA